MWFLLRFGGLETKTLRIPNERFKRMHLGWLPWDLVLKQNPKSKL